MANHPTRIFIDCYLVDFSKQPTGIPRVVLNYIEEGYGWGASNGVEVIPVIPSPNGPILVRPVPGNSPPPLLINLAAKSAGTDQTPLWVVAAIDAITYATNIAAALLNLVAAILPWKAILASVRAANARLISLPSTVLKRRRAIGDALTVFQLRPGDVVFCPAYWHDVDPAIYRAYKTRGARVILLVHDILPVTHAKFYNSPWKYDFRDKVLQAPSYSDALFCVSEFTKNSLVEFLVRQKRTIPSTSLAINGFEPLTSEEGTRLIKGRSAPIIGNTASAIKLIRERTPYIMVGSVEPKKGHIPTIQCFENMWNSGLERGLVIIGRKGWMDQQITERIEKSVFFGEKLFWFSNFDDFDLADAYIHSRALVFSSIAEGFGIPLIEAAFYEKPAVVFDTPISREVLGGLGLFFTDAAGLVRRVMDVEDPEMYAEACSKAATLKWPKWNEVGKSVFSKLRALGESGDTSLNQFVDPTARRELELSR